MRCFVFLATSLVLTTSLLDINFACHDDSECGPGLVCYNNQRYGKRCEDHEPPKIVLNFGNQPAPVEQEPPQAAPDVQLHFPGGKTEDCADVIEECEGPSHPNCQAAQNGMPGGQYWAQNCKMSCGLCDIEERVEKKFENFGQQQQQPQQSAYSRLMTNSNSLRQPAQTQQGDLPQNGAAQQGGMSLFTMAMYVSVIGAAVFFYMGYQNQQQAAQAYTSIPTTF